MFFAFGAAKGFAHPSAAAAMFFPFGTAKGFAHPSAAAAMFFPFGTAKGFAHPFSRCFDVLSLWRRRGIFAPSARAAGCRS
jgi:hypothetical protein